MNRISREVGIGVTAAGVGAVLVAVVLMALQDGGEPRPAAEGVTALAGAPVRPDVELREAAGQLPVNGAAQGSGAGGVSTVEPTRGTERVQQPVRTAAAPSASVAVASPAGIGAPPPAPHEALANSIVMSLGWRQEPEDAANLGRWLERSAGERASVLAGYAEGAERAHAHNQVLKSHLAELRATFGDLRAGQVVERLRLTAMDPETGEPYAIDVEGNAIDR